MRDPFSRYVETATQVTRQTAERIVRSLWKQGEGTGEKGLVDDLLERSQGNREAIAELVRAETKRVISAMGLATRDDVERLEQEIAELRQPAAGEEAAGRLEAETLRGTREAAKKTAARTTTRKATSGEAQLPPTTPETARKAATAPRATRTAAERTVPPGEATGSGESPPVPEPTVVDAETQEGDG